MSYNAIHMANINLGELELVVMLSVSRLADAAYGLRIRDDVSAVRSCDYSVGAIYSTLQRLEAKGLLESAMSDPLPVRGGRSRRYYHLTAAGRRSLAVERRAAQKLWGPFDGIRTV